MKTKTILTVAAIAFGSIALFGYNKYNSAVQVMDSITYGIKRISNVKLSFKNISFNAVILLQNATNIDFGATLTSKIIIKQIRVYNKQGEYLGKAETEIYGIDLPAYGTAELPEMKFSIDTLKAANEFFTNQEAYTNLDFTTNLLFKIDVEVFGNVITL